MRTVESDRFQNVPTTCAARRVMTRSKQQIVQKYDHAVSKDAMLSGHVDRLKRYHTDEWMSLQLVRREDLAALAAHNKGGFGRASFDDVFWELENNGPRATGDFLYDVETTEGASPLYNLLGEVCGIGIGLAAAGTSRENRTTHFVDERRSLLDRVERVTGLAFPAECREYKFSPVLPLVEFPANVLERNYATELVDMLSEPIIQATPATVDLFEVTARDEVPMAVELR